MPDLADLRAGDRLLARLPGFLRHPVGVDEARRELAHRLDRCGEIFLSGERTWQYPWKRRRIAHGEVPA